MTKVGVDIFFHKHQMNLKFLVVLVLLDKSRAWPKKRSAISTRRTAVLVGWHENHFPSGFILQQRC